MLSISSKLIDGIMLNTILSFFQVPHRVARPGGTVVSVYGSWPSGCEFETRLRRNLFLAYFRLSPLLKHVRKAVGGFGKKFVSVLV